MSKAKRLIEQHETVFSTEVEIDTFGNPPGLPKDSYLATKSKANIKWTLDEDHRSWGVKSLSPMVRDQEIELVYIESTEDDDIEHIVNWPIKNAQSEFSSSMESPSSIQILPVTLEINFSKNTSKVIFSIS